MERRIIAEMPIYAFSPKEFEKRWKEKKKRKCSKLIAQGYSKEDAEEIVTRLYTFQSQWRYNQLVGMMCLYVKNDDSIYFGLYCKDGDRKYRITTECSPPFPDRLTYVSRSLIVFKDDTNEKIRRGIKNKIIDLQSLEQIKTFYIDCEAFNNLTEAVNFKSYYLLVNRIMVK